MDFESIQNYLYSLTYGHPVIRTPFGQRYLINADVTASGYPNKLVENYMINRVLPYYNNTHSNAYSGRMMTHYIHEAKSLIKKSINAGSDDQIILTGNGCSGAVNHLIHCLDLQHRSVDSVVVFISKAEHHSNHLPWQHLPVTLIYVPLLSNGLIDFNFLQRELAKYQHYPLIIASFNATSNVTGVHQDTQHISRLVHQYNGRIFWDFAASGPYVPINMHYNDSNGQFYDAIFISIHKFFGGPGSPGLLVANKSLFQNEVPYCPAGGTVRFACPRYQVYYQDIETKETGGTPNILGSIKAGLAFDFKNRYQNYISKWEKEIIPYIERHLRPIKNLKIINPENNLHRQPIFAFMIDQLHYNYVVVLLNDLFGIQTRGGISCCSLLAQDLLKINPHQQSMILKQIIQDQGIPSNYGWCRVSFHYSMPRFLIDYIIYAIQFVAKYGSRIAEKKLYKYYPHKNTWLYCPNGCPWNDFSQFRLSLDDANHKTSTVYLNPVILSHQINETIKSVKSILSH